MGDTFLVLFGNFLHFLKWFFHIHVNTNTKWNHTTCLHVLCLSNDYKSPFCMWFRSSNIPQNRIMLGCHIGIVSRSREAWYAHKHVHTHTHTKLNLWISKSWTIRCWILIIKDAIKGLSTRFLIHVCEMATCPATDPNGNDLSAKMQKLK